jgi:hypothetical protein
MIDFINFGFALGLLTYMMGFGQALMALAILTVFCWISGFCYEWYRLSC